MDPTIPFICVTSANSRWEMGKFPIPVKAFCYRKVTRTHKYYFFYLDLKCELKTIYLNITFTWPVGCTVSSRLPVFYMYVFHLFLLLA